MAVFANTSESAEDYLEFYETYAGRCMNLLRGNMRMVRNTHPEKTIEYRMIRELGGIRQASVIQSRVEPGEEGRALGCEKIEGREQIWMVIRARFVDSPE